MPKSLGIYEAPDIGSIGGMVGSVHTANPLPVAQDCCPNESIGQLTIRLRSGGGQLLGDTHRPTDRLSEGPTVWQPGRLTDGPTDDSAWPIVSRATGRRTPSAANCGHSTVHSRPTKPRGPVADPHEARRPTEESDATQLATDPGSADSTNRRTAARRCQL